MVENRHIGKRWRSLTRAFQWLTLLGIDKFGAGALVSFNLNVRTVAIFYEVWQSQCL